MHTILKSNTKEVIIGADKPFVMIGEKLNPTGLKKLGQALVEQNFEYVKQLAKRQVAWGADVLDVNVGHPQIDEVAIMPKVVEAVLSVVDVPLCIDSNEPKILEAGLEVAPGKPLVNSVNGEEKQLATVLPIVKDRGAAVIGLTIGEEGIPDDGGRASRGGGHDHRTRRETGHPDRRHHHRSAGDDGGTQQQRRAGDTENHRTDQEGIWRQYQSGREQCFLWLAGPPVGEQRVPGACHASRRDLLDHGPDQTGQYDPRDGFAAWQGQQLDALFEIFPCDGEIARAGSGSEG